MIEPMLKPDERHRFITAGQYSDESYGVNGAWTFGALRVIATDGAGITRWEHVSVSLPDRCPTWEEMCRIKAKFWTPESTVVQFHPPKSSYVNCHPYCLHMWRLNNQEFQRPTEWMVGPIDPK